jgi:endo-1,4-beta-xylanase
MPAAPFRHRFRLLLSALLLPLGAHAQIAAGKDKFLGNIIAGSVPASFNTYWNQVTPENSAKWGSVEGTRNTMNWAQLDTAYNQAQSSGFKFKAHTLVWGSQYPAWITSLTPAEQRTEIEEWMTLLAARYPNLWALDVVNEPIKTPLPFKNALGGDGATGWDWVITSFQLARTKFPNARLLINEYGTENDASARNQMLEIISLLKARGLIDGIGIQAHAFNLDHMTAAQMTTCLEAYAATGLDLYITELDIRGIGATRTEAAQSAKYQELFPVMWTHPAVKGITLWGYITGQTWMTDSGIMTSDGAERAALTWLKGYVNGLTPPSAPSNLAASTASASTIGLTWTDSASNETAFKVESSTAASGPWSEIAGSLAANTTSYTATGLNAATTYYFRVRASNTAGDSAYSAPAAAATAAVSTGGGGGSSGGGGGGGAPSLWFLAFLCLAVLGRLRPRRNCCRLPAVAP